MASKMVTNQRKECLPVVSAALEESRHDRVTEGLLLRFADVLPEGTTEITLTQVQMLLGHQLQHMRDRAIVHDNLHIRELLSDRLLRQRRDGSAEKVYTRLVRVGSVYEGVYGPGSRTQLFGTVDSRIPTDPTRLHQFGRRAMDWLLDPDLAIAESDLEGIAVDRVVLADSLRTHLDTLGEALEGLAKERVASVDSLVDKHRSLDNLGVLTGQGARYLEALYDLAGMEEESDRLRPTSHRSRAELETELGPETGVAGDGADRPFFLATGSEHEPKPGS